MPIQSVQLTNFRNYAELSLDFTAPVTCVLGENAQGKTNLLEAVFVLGRGHSFRTHEKNDLIARGASAARVAAVAEHDGLRDTLAVEFSGGRRSVQRNGKRVARPDAQWPHVILFAPEETLLFKGAPEARRDYLDTLIEGMDPAFRPVRLDYARVLKQRNHILRNAWEQPRVQVLAQLAPWTDQLIQLGMALVDYRTRWCTHLGELLPIAHGQFAEKDGGIVLQYQPHIKNSDEFIHSLSTRVDEEIARGTTVAGPQRDDCGVTLAGHDLRHYGSQGQHRSVVLSLKLAEVRLAQLLRRRTPTLLLDDVASELDPIRGTAFFELLTRTACQIVLTTTHAEGFVSDLVAGAQRVTIQNGILQIESMPAHIPEQFARTFPDLADRGQ